MPYCHMFLHVLPLNNKDIFSCQSRMQKRITSPRSRHDPHQRALRHEAHAVCKVSQNAPEANARERITEEA